MRQISIRLADMPKITLNIGFVGENAHTKILIDCKKIFDDYPNATSYITVFPPIGNSYPVMTAKVGDYVTWDVSASDVANEGDGQAQITFTDNDEVIQSYVAKTHIFGSINPGDAPDPITNWIAEANAAIGTINGAVEAAEDAQDAAEDAQDAAEDAKTAAETAQGLAEDAQEAAEAARDKAAQWATGGTTGTPGASNNAKYYSEQSSGFADNSAASALVAEGYAAGTQNGTDVASGSPYFENNAKYYAEEAADSADEAAASAAALDPDTIARVDGYYENMTVGNAEQVVSTVGVTDKVPYNFRTACGSADIGNRMTDKIVGGTICWNQQIHNGNFANTDNWGAYGSATDFAASGNVASITAPADGKSRICQAINSIIPNHVYLITCEFKHTTVQTKSGAGIGVATSTTGGANVKELLLKDAEINKWLQIDYVLVYTGSANLDVLFCGTRSSGTNANDAADTFSFRNVMLIDLTKMFGSTIANYIAALETATEGAGVAWFRKLFPKPYYAYNAGELMSVQAASHNTVGFNAWDEEWELGIFNYDTGAESDATNQIRSKNYIPVLPNTTYYIKIPGTVLVLGYDANKNFLRRVRYNSGNATFLTRTLNGDDCYYIRFCTIDTPAYGNTYNHDICINLSWDGERDGEYEAYIKREYALGDVELLGRPKLDENNELYYDGDEYESDGTVTRRYELVDLSQVTLITKATGDVNKVYSFVVPKNYFAARVSDNLTFFISDKYTYWGSNSAAGLTPIVDTADVGLYSYYNSGALTGTMYIIVPKNDSVSGHLVYMIAEPYTESADPFQTPQVVDDFGTEEYVDRAATAAVSPRDVAIPVGHESHYQANLRAKLEMAPNSPEDGDGDYIVRQTGGINEYVKLINELPTAPGTDGTYTLKITVASGTPTLSWAQDT